MKDLAEHMAFYGSYHRDWRNRLTHFIGVPLIMFSILIPMGWLRIGVAGVELSLAMLFTLAVLVYYFLLDAALALAMTVFTVVLLALAEHVAAWPLGISATIFAVAFVGDWIIQLIGHGFEGKRPALFDNLFQVIVAPIFLMAELFFGLGAKRSLRTRVETLIEQRMP